jgi:hypothetical protein
MPLQGFFALLYKETLLFTAKFAFSHSSPLTRDDKGGDRMAITYNKDKRSGLTYAYETTYVWDKEKKQSRSKRTLIGRLDESTGEIVSTDGRGRKRSHNYVPAEDDYQMPKTVKELKSEILRLLEENKMLREKVDVLTKKIKRS